MTPTPPPPPPPRRRTPPSSPPTARAARRCLILAAVCLCGAALPAVAFAPPRTRTARRPRGLVAPARPRLLLSAPPRRRARNAPGTTAAAAPPGIVGRSLALSAKAGGGKDEERDDAKDLEEARDASALLESISRALGWFGKDDEGRREEARAREAASDARAASETSENEEAGGGFPWPWSLIDPESDEAKKRSLKDDIKTKYRDLSRDGFGPLLPVAEKVDELTGGWGLSYADLSPETPKTPAGVAFLATNAFYALAGLALSLRGELLLGTMTELAGAVSFWYHYSQLEFGQDRSEVRLALLTDYATAGTALITGGIYLVNLGVQAVPFDVLIVGGLSVACLTMSWVWEFGYSYLFWHSLWHVLSAYAGYLVGRAHVGDGAGALQWTTLGALGDLPLATTMTMAAMAAADAGGGQGGAGWNSVSSSTMAGWDDPFFPSSWPDAAAALSSAAAPAAEALRRAVSLPLPPPPPP